MNWAGHKAPIVFLKWFFFFSSSVEGNLMDASGKSGGGTREKEREKQLGRKNRYLNLLRRAVRRMGYLSSDQQRKEASHPRWHSPPSFPTRPELRKERNLSYKSWKRGTRYGSDFLMPSAGDSSVGSLGSLGMDGTSEPTNRRTGLQRLRIRGNPPWQTACSAPFKL